MKISKMLHSGSAIVGFIGSVIFISAVVGGGDNLVFGITKFDAMFCSAILILVAIWFQIATIHHMTLEKNGEII